MTIKIALINPGKDKQYAVQEPLNLGFLASYLENHKIKVKIIDQLVGQNPQKEISKYNPDFVGITGTTPLIEDGYKIGIWCVDHDFPVIFGGVHASIMLNETDSLYTVVKGEGEKALLKIVRGEVPLGEVIQGEYIRNLDDIPPPARHLIDMDFYMKSKDRNSDSYLYFVPKHTKVASMLTSRGCPWSCSFCWNSFRGTPIRYNSPIRVVTEINHLVERYNVKTIFFIEDNFFMNKDRVRRISALLLGKYKNDIVWGANARVDNIDKQILQVVKEAGCKQITFGFESGSQKVLDALNKKTTVEQNKKAIKLCRESGIIPQGTVMIGSPTETIEDINETREFIRKTNIQDTVGICITTPYPGTELWKYCEENELIPKSFNWSDFNYQNIPISCSMIPVEELQSIYYEMVDEFSENRPLKFEDAVRTCIQHPLITFKKIMRDPSKILKAWKRIDV